MPGAITAALAAITIADVALFLAKAVLSFAIQAAFAKSPDKPQDAGLASQSLTLSALEPAAPWDVVFGEVRKGGTIVFRHATPDTGSRQDAESAVVPHTEPYTVTVPTAADWMADVSVTAREWVETTDSDGNFVGSYADVTYVLVVGTPAQGEYSAVAGVYTFNAADAGKSVQILFTRRIITDDHAHLHFVIVLAAHECEAIGDIYFDDEVVTLDGDGFGTGKWAGFTQVTKHLGTADQAADAALMTAAPEKWTADHRLRGHAYIYARLSRSRTLFPSVPNISAMVKGLKLYDSRSTLTAWGANASLCIAAYLNNPTWGLGAAYGTEIDTTLLSAAASVDDEDVNLAAGGTEDRYTCNGVIDTSLEPQAILEKLLTSNAGRMVYIGGKWRLRSGAYITPGITLDEGDARDTISVKTRRPRDSVFNAVKGLYLSPDNKWQAADFPAVTSATYLAEDNGERIWENIDLPFTKSPATAQRIAKIVLERVRRQVSMAYRASTTAYRVEPPETLMLTNTILGYSSKVFEVMELKLTPATDPDGVPIIEVQLALEETDSAVYTWSSNEETQVAPAPTTNLPDPSQVAPPGIPSVTEALYETTGSTGVKAKATVRWAAAPQGQAWRYEHEYKLKSAVDWIPNGNLINGTLDEIFDLSAGIYQSRVRTLNALGGHSMWSQAEYEIIGLTAAPSDLTGFSLQVLNGLAHLVWNQAADLDVRNGGYVRIRWSPLMSGATWNEAIDIGAAVPGMVTQTTLPLLPGTYLAKPVDSTGHAAASAVSIITDAPSVMSFTRDQTLTVHSAFLGDKTNVIYDASLGGLKLDSGTLIDDMTDPIDSWPSIDSSGGIAATGEFIASTAVDLGAVYTARFTPLLKAEGYDTGDLWDSRIDPIDSWGSIDGDVVDDANVRLNIRTTPDDPAGAPVWSGWNPLQMGDYTARGYQFRVVFTSLNATHNVLLRELSIAVDIPERFDGEEDIASGAGSYAVTYSAPFKYSPVVGITAQNMATGDYYAITSKTRTGFTIVFRNSGAAAVNRTFDWIANGYGAEA